MQTPSIFFTLSSQIFTFPLSHTLNFSLLNPNKALKKLILSLEKFSKFESNDTWSACHLQTEEVSPPFFWPRLSNKRPWQTIRNKNGAIGSPCLRPLISLNYVVGIPLTKIEIVEDSKHSLIQCTHFSKNPILVIM